MSDNPNALSPLDGRYADRVAPMRQWFSEHSLMRFRVHIEIAWFRSLCAHPDVPETEPLDAEADAFLTALETNYSEQDTLAIKAIERETNHDVKAIEYYLKARFEAQSALPALATQVHILHFACTSEDINNLALGLMLQGARTLLCERIDELLNTLRGMAHQWADIPMLSRTHGQPASPTTVGKELAIFAARLARQQQHIRAVALSGKINGASGNYNAHLFACPNLDWPAHARGFVEGLGLQWNPLTAQAEPHDCIAELLHALCRLNTVALDMCRDIWGYISLGYFGQRINNGEVGSSTMPHKVNPIDFENAEGNLGIANALAGHLAAKLPISRWQRDLSDSTALRNLGTVFGHCHLAYGAIEHGLQRLQVQPGHLNRDLDQAPEVLTEAVQTLMRLRGMPSAYEQLKELSRNKALDAATLSAFIDNLALEAADRSRLQALTPADYTGNAADQARTASTQPDSE